MIKRNLNNLLSSVTVIHEGIFTRAATQLGMTQSALSQSINGLETRLQIRLLTHATRSVSPTVAGERLLNAIGNRFDEIEAKLDELLVLRDKPSGTVRITCGDHIQRTLSLPRLTPLLLEYPDIKVELDVNYAFQDIVTDRFDAGVCLGDTADKDMTAVPTGPPVRMAVVMAPAYFVAHPKPRSSRDLIDHNCINMYMQPGGGLYVWDFQRKGRHVNVRVDEQLIFNASPNIVDAALAGLGIAQLPEEEFAPCIEEGRLLRVLESQYSLLPGCCLYYPNRRQSSPAFSLVMNALRYTRPRGTAPQASGSEYAGTRSPATHHGVDDL